MPRSGIAAPAPGSHRGGSCPSTGPWWSRTGPLQELADASEHRSQLLDLLAKAEIVVTQLIKLGDLSSELIDLLSHRGEMTLELTEAFDPFLPKIQESSTVFHQMGEGELIKARGGSALRLTQPAPPPYRQRENHNGHDQEDRHGQQDHRQVEIEFGCPCSPRQWPQECLLGQDGGDHEGGNADE